MNEPHKNVELKLQRLEELLVEWKKESEQEGAKTEARIRQMTIRIVCIVFGVIGSLWSVVEFGDWYLQKRAITKMAENYMNIAEQNFQQTGDVSAAFRMTQKAKELDEENPVIQYKYVYFKSQELLQQLRQITRPLTAEELSRLNETFSEIDVLKKQVKNPADFYALEAELLYQQGKYKQAQKAIQRAIQSTEHPKPEWLRRELTIASQLDKVKDVEKIAQRIRQLWPDSSWAFYAQGLLERERDNYKSAQENFQKAVEVAPDFADAWDNLSSAAYSTLPRDLKTARKAAKQVIKLRPGACAAAYNRLVLVYLAEDHNEIALAFAEKGISLFPDYLSLRRAKINALLALKRYDEALQENSELRKLMPDNLNTVRQECDIYLNKRDFSAMYHSTLFWENLIESKSQKSNYYNSIAWNLFILGKDYPLALRLVDKAIQLDPSAESVDTKSWILIRMGKKDELEQAMEQCLALATDRGHRGKMLSFQAQMFIELGNLDRAKEKLEESEKLYSNNPLLFLARAKYSIASGDMAHAEKEITDGLKVASNDQTKASLHWAYALLYRKRADYEKALAELEIVAQNIDTGYLEIQQFYAAYADTLFQLGQLDKAEKAAQTVLEYAPENEELQAVFHKIKAKDGIAKTL